MLQDKDNGKHVNTKDIKKHRSDVLKNVVILEEAQIMAPASVVSSVKEFVASIRAEWATLASPLAKSIDQSEAFVDRLLEQLNELFTEEQ